MKNLLITIKYDGSAYHGWQVQKNALTVQEVFQNAAQKVFGERPAVTGCSRTDSGVHAEMYCLTLKTKMDITNRGVVMALNTHLPPDIAAVDCRAVDDDFHPRYSCVSKEYVYRLYNGSVRNPFLKNYACHYRYNIDAEYLNSEARAFVGTHDFRGFCSSGCTVENTVRTVKAFSVERQGDMVIFRTEADGFLYNMVRIMVGTLLYVSQGRIKSGELVEIIDSGDRTRAGKTAPPQGLYLNKVNYGTVK